MHEVILGMERACKKSISGWKDGGWVGSVIVFEQSMRDRRLLKKTWDPRKKTCQLQTRDIICNINVVIVVID